MSALSGFRIQRAIPIYISTDGSCFTRNCLQFRSCTTCIVYVISSKIARLELASLFRESGCKGKEFFAYPPNFRGTFFEVFFSAASPGPEPQGSARPPLGPLCAKGGKERAAKGGNAGRGCIMSSIRASLVEAGAKVRIITGRASGKEVFFRGFPKKKGKGLVFRTVTEEGRAGGSERGEGRDTIYILRAGARVH